jgi:membrane protein required for colicin V production
MTGAIFGGLKALLILSVLLLFFDRLNKQFGIVKEEVLNASVLYSPILIQSQEFYPNVLEEFEKQKEHIDDITDDL